MSGPTTLYYFPGRGRAEQIRLALAEAGIEFVEGGGNLGELRTDGTATFGSLPILKHEGVKLAQGCACALYIAEKYGFAGSTVEEKALVNQFVLAAEDLRGPVVSLYWFKKGTKEEFMEGTSP